jgi:hypothetical protein
MKRAIKVRWRPIKTAPKDRHILLRYPSLSDNGKTYVNQGRWVDVLHQNVLEKFLSEGRKIDIPETPHDGHWAIAYVAILEHGGAWIGYTFENRGCRVAPTHWLPLPDAPNKSDL